jgi:hypothetical protein
MVYIVLDVKEMAQTESIKYRCLMCNLNFSTVELALDHAGWNDDCMLEELN